MGSNTESNMFNTFAFHQQQQQRQAQTTVTPPQLVIQMQQLAGGDATTLNSWLEAACVSTADVERRTLGAIKAETWQHLHAHFSQVADKCTQQAAQLQSLTSGLEEANKEKERLATRLR